MNPVTWPYPKIGDSQQTVANRSAVLVWLPKTSRVNACQYENMNMILVFDIESFVTSHVCFHKCWWFRELLISFMAGLCWCLLSITVVLLMHSCCISIQTSKVCRWIKSLLKSGFEFFSCFQSSWLTLPRRLY